MGASVVASVAAPPVLEPAEHALDLVVLTVKRSVVRDRHLTVGLRRDAGNDAAFVESIAEPVCIVALVAEHRLGLRQDIEHQGRAFVVAHLPRAEQQDQRPSLAIAVRAEFEDDIEKSLEFTNDAIDQSTSEDNKLILQTNIK